MPIFIGHRGIIGDIAGTIARLEALVSHLERVGSGEMPSIQELEAAPLLDPFAVSTRPLPCLVGGNGGHPVLRGPLITTSEVWVMAPELGWARTYSRLYRLGEPFHPDAQL
jgi:hypothetical protein